MFGLECVCTFLEENGFCASCCVDEYVKEAQKLGWEFDKGFLFSDAKNNKRVFGQVKPASLTNLLKLYLVQFDIFDNETMQSFRSWGAIFRILEGESLKEVMYRAY